MGRCCVDVRDELVVLLKLACLEDVVRSVHVRLIRAVLLAKLKDRLPVNLIVITSCPFGIAEIDIKSVITHRQV